MENLDGKLQVKQEAIKAAEKNLKHAKKAYKNNGSQVRVNILLILYLVSCL